MADDSDGVRICAGDSVLLGVGEDRYWTCSLAKVPMCEVTAAADILDPAHCVFTVASADAETGSALVPGGKVSLQHRVTGLFVSCQGECAVALTSDSSQSQIVLSLLDEKPFVYDSALCALGVEDTEKGKLSLNQELKFTTEATAGLRIVKYADFSLSEGCICYNEPVKLMANDLFFSLRPRFGQSGRIAIREEDQIATFSGSAEAKYYPEYDGELNAHLTKDAEDWNGSWSLEREQRLHAGAVNSGDSVYIRSIPSGRYLDGEGKLVARPDAVQWRLTALDPAATALSYSQPFSLLSPQGETLVVDRTPTLPNLQALLFLPLSPTTQFRLSLTSQSAEASGPKLQFSIERILPREANNLLTIAACQPLLSYLRALLQNIIKVQEIDQELLRFDSSIDLSRVFSDCKVADMMADLQVVSELIRVWTLMKITHGLFGFDVKGLKCIKDIRSAVAETLMNRRVAAAVFAQRDLLSPIISVSPYSVCKLLLPALTHPLPNVSDHLHWAAIFSTLSEELKSYGHYIALSAFLHRLLTTLPREFSLLHIPVLQLGDEFVFKMLRDEGSCAVWSFGVQRKVPEVGEKLSAFVCEMLQLAAALCARSAAKGKIIESMGLELDFLVEAFADCQEKPKIQVGILVFLAVVHVPDCGSAFPLSRLADCQLINETAFLESALAQEQRTDIYSFAVADSSLVNLLQFEVNFWLCELLSQVRTESGLWYEVMAAHLLFLTKLVTHRCVSDVFIAITFECVSAVLKDFVINATEDSQFLGKDRAGAEKMALLGQFWDYVETVQLWKLFRVTQELIVTEAFQVSKEQVNDLLAALQSPIIMLKYLSSSSGEESTVHQAMKILINNPENDTGSLLACLIQAVPIVYSRRSQQIDTILKREGDMCEWVLSYLLLAADDSLSLPFLVMVRGIQAYGCGALEKTDSEDSDLGEVVNSLESLCDILTSLTTSNLQHFQSILQKANFALTLDSLLLKADTFEGVEIPLYVDFISLVLEAARLYATGSDRNRGEIAALLPSHAAFLDYPQYIKLLLELDLLKQEALSGIVLLLIEFAQLTKFKRPILAIESLLSDKSQLPVTLVVISTYYATVEKPALTAIDWEVVIAALCATPAPVRPGLFEKVLLRWYEADASQIRREGAAVLVYAGETTNPLFHVGLVETISHIEQALTADHVMEAHFKLCEFGRIQRARNSESAGSDLLYVLELLWHKSAGIVAQIPGWMQRISLQDMMMQLAKLFLCLPPAEALKEQITLLVNTLRLYVLRTDDPLQDDDKDFLLSVCLKEVGPFDSEEPGSLQIKPPAQLFTLS